MKKTIIKTISVALVFVLTLAVLSSCGWYPFGDPSIFPEGYTGGFGIGYGSMLEYYWVETYEECIEAIELLKSHGSTFEETAIFSYEGDLFDTKYCFKIDGSKSEYVKYGDNPFDRRGANVRVESYAFFEDVTIDELVYSYVDFYKVSYLTQNDYFEENNSAIDFSTVELVYKWDEYYKAYFAYYNENHIFCVYSYNENNPSDDSIKAILSSIEVVKGNK